MFETNSIASKPPQNRSESQTLLMKPGNENCLTKNMTVHGINDSHARVRRLLRRALRHVEFRIERIKFERVVMVWPRGRTRPHVAICTPAYLAAAVRQVAGVYTLG